MAPVHAQNALLHYNGAKTLRPWGFPVSAARTLRARLPRNNHQVQQFFVILWACQGGTVCAWEHLHDAGDARWSSCCVDDSAGAALCRILSTAILDLAYLLQLALHGPLVTAMARMCRRTETRPWIMQLQGDDAPTKKPHTTDTANTQCHRRCFISPHKGCESGNQCVYYRAWLLDYLRSRHWHQHSIIEFTLKQAQRIHNENSRATVAWHQPPGTKSARGMHATADTILQTRAIWAHAQTRGAQAP